MAEASERIVDLVPVAETGCDDLGLLRFKARTLLCGDASRAREEYKCHSQESHSLSPRQYDFRAVRLTSGALRGLASSRPEPHVLLAQTSEEVSHGQV